MSASMSGPPSLPDIFQDLEARFLLNLPDSELSSFPRLFFQLQQAQWFYCDFYVDRWPHALPPYTQLKAFCSKFFSLSPLLSSQLSRFEDVYESFSTYLQSVPVCGVILLNPRMDRVVMVRGWKGNSWSFPKGKIDANETELQCALRECREEVGYDVGDAQVGEDDWIEAAVSGKSVRLFVVCGVDESFHFETRTRKEISGIEWVDISALPSYRDQKQGGGGAEEGEKKKKFWNVMPFVDELKRWIGNKKKGKRNQPKSKQPQTQQQLKPIRPPASQPIAIQPAHTPTSLTPTPSHHSHPQPLSTSLPSSSPHHQSYNHRPHTASSSGRQSIDDSNALTFASSTASAGKGVGGLEGGGGRWSAEEMFALNEAKYGVRSSVVEEKLEVPDNIDEIMRSVMGPKYRGGGGGRGSTRGDRGSKQHRSARSEQLTNQHSALPPTGAQSPLATLPEQSTIAASQQPVRGKGFRGRGRGNARTLPSPNTNTSATSAPQLNVEELDFSHNPYQPRTLAATSTSTSATTAATPSTSSPHFDYYSNAATHYSAPPSVLPSPAAFSHLAAKSAANPPTTAQPSRAAYGSAAAGGAQPYSARDSDRPGGRASQSSASEFRFDLDSIMQPLSATKLD